MQALRETDLSAVIHHLPPVSGTPPPFFQNQNRQRFQAIDAILGVTAPRLQGRPQLTMPVRGEQALIQSHLRA